MKMYRVLMLVLLCLLAACASSGNAKLKEMNKDDLLAHVKEGVTTKQQVEAALGSPNSVTFSDTEKEVWTYHHSKSTSHGSNFIPYVNLFSSGHDTETKELIIMFDQNGIAVKRTVRVTNNEFKTGILGNS